MLISRNIDGLRSDVTANCPTLNDILADEVTL